MVLLERKRRQANKLPLDIIAMMLGFVVLHVEVFRLEILLAVHAGVVLRFLGLACAHAVCGNLSILLCYVYRDFDLGLIKQRIWDQYNICSCGVGYFLWLGYYFDLLLIGGLSVE